MGISPQELGLRRHIVNTRPLITQLSHAGAAH